MSPCTLMIVFFFFVQEGSTESIYEPAYSQTLKEVLPKYQCSPALRRRKPEWGGSDPSINSVSLLLWFIQTQTWSNVDDAHSGRCPNIQTNLKTLTLETCDTPQITYWLHKECLCDTGWKPALHNPGSTSGNQKERQKEGNCGADEACSLMPFTSLRLE